MNSIDYFMHSKIHLFTLDKTYDNISWNKAILLTYGYVNNAMQIIKKTIINIDTKKRNDSGYYYYNKLQFSVQHVSANRAIKEIITQLNGYNYMLNIILHDNTNLVIENGNIIRLEKKYYIH